jgi:translation initiation factor 2 subunit 1
MYKDVPDQGEFVVVEVDEIHEHSAGVHIEGYDEHGMIHISEVSRSWVRDIRKELEEGEKTVAQVLEVDDGSINLSLKRVNDKQKRETMQKWNKEEKADKFLQRVADQTGDDRDDLYAEVAFPFQKAYGSTFEGFERAAMEDVDYADLGVDDELAGAVEDVAQVNISLKNVEMEGEMDIQVPGTDGISTIKDALDVGDTADISYVSAPTYEITVWGRNAEDAKNKMDTARKSIRQKIEDAGGTFEFTKK